MTTIADMQEILDVLREAEDVLRHGWIKGNYGSYVSDTDHCAIGAVRRAAYRMNPLRYTTGSALATESYLQRLARTARRNEDERFRFYSSVEAFNDAPFTRYEDVQEFFSEAINRVEHEIKELENA